MKNKDIVFYIINLLYGTFMIFSNILPSIIVAIISSIIYLYDYIKLSKKYSKSIALFFNSILFLPVSFISVLGTSYASLPITWFSVSILLLTLIVILTNNLKRIYVFFYILFVTLFVFSLSFISSYMSSLSQFFTISLCLFSLQIGELLKKDSSKNVIYKSLDFYLLSVLSLALQIVIQRFYIMKTGTIIGHYSLMGGNRIAFAGLMSDYSFASLYLVTGSLILLLLYMHYKKISFFKFSVFFLLFTFISILTSARTGFFSLIIVVFLCFLLNLNKKHLGRIMMLSVIAIVAIPFAFHFMASLRTLDSFLDGSGRVELMKRAFSIIEIKPLFGVGFGIENLKSNYGMMLPHNYFIQYLLQFGIIGTLIITLNFITFYTKNKKNNFLMWLFILCFIGAMLIPDIVSSRFLAIVLIIVTMNKKSEGAKYEKK